MKIFQGDQYAIPITVKRGGQVQTDAQIQKLEIVLAEMRKVYPDEIPYNESTRQFLFPLDQADSLGLEDGSYDVNGRAFYVDGTISGWQKIGNIQVIAMEGAEKL